jgi:hypothetical protein
MLLKDLIVTQEGIRNCKQIAKMVESVKNGNFWTKDYLVSYSPKNEKKFALIQISQTEDGKLYIHDGCHRTCSTFLGGRDYLREDEFQIKTVKYSDYLEINFDNFWLTPFDLKTEVRKADFFDFKNKALEYKKLYGEEYASNWILSNTNLFKQKRTCNLISELVEKIQL